MTWANTVDEEKAWLCRMADSAPNEALRTYYRALVGLLDTELAHVLIGYAHHIGGEDGGEDSCDCGCSHGEDRRSNRAFLYHLLSDPVTMAVAGYSAYLPGLDGIRSHHLPGIKAKNLVVIVSTEAICAELLASSTHPKKNSLKVLPFTFGHLWDLVAEKTVLTDQQVIADFDRLMGRSLSCHVMGFKLGLTAPIPAPRPQGNRLLAWGNLMRGTV